MTAQPLRHATAGLWYANVRLRRRRSRTRGRADAKLHAYSHYGDVSSRPTTDRRADLLVRADGDAAVFFTTRRASRSDGVKLVRRY